MANVEQFIAGLSREARPVKPLPHPFVSWVKWALVAVIYVGGLIACSSLRPDLANKFHDRLFTAEIGALVAMVFASALSIAVLSFPDMHQKKCAAYLPLAPFICFCIVLALESSQNLPPPVDPKHSGLECLLCIVFWSLLPASATFYRLRKTASTHPLLAGAAALLAATSIGCLVLRLTENNDSVAHLLTWHYLPMTVLTVLGLVLGKKLLRW